MKKTIFSVACAIALAAGMTSCGTVGLVGAVYMDTTEPTAVTSNNLGTKVGQAEAISVLGVAAVGDAGIEKAAKQAGIKKVSHIDKKTFSVLGLFTKVTYTVYGE
jgi:hypothetical protein